jgi:cytochrome c biogenesis protein CcdA
MKKMKIYKKGIMPIIKVINVVKNVSTNNTNDKNNGNTANNTTEKKDEKEKAEKTTLRAMLFFTGIASVFIGILLLGCGIGAMFQHFSMANKCSEKITYYEAITSGEVIMISVGIALLVCSRILLKTCKRLRAYGINEL